MQERCVLSSAVGRFRVIALLEGISFLVLLGIAMPIKYAGDNPKPVLYVGWAHGVLYILYALAGFQAMSSRQWPAREALRGFLASVLPAGTFIYDWAFLRGEYRAERLGERRPSTP
jgi:integral membrane protein